MNKSYPINLGLVLGGISIVLFLIMAIIQGGMLFSFAIGIISLAIMIMLPIYFIRKQRAAAGGIISFKDAFLTAFVGLIIGGVIYLLFSFVYANYIDASYVDTVVNQQVEGAMKFMKGNMPEDKMVEALTKMENDTRAGFTPAGMAKTFGIMLAVYLVLSLILAATLKKKPENPFDSAEVIDN